MEWNRFDIVEAHYAFYVDWHNGMSSTLYQRQCRISQYFKPSPLFNGYEDLSENGQEIYDALIKKHGFDTKVS